MKRYLIVMSAVLGLTLGAVVGVFVYLQTIIVS